MILKQIFCFTVLTLSFPLVSAFAENPPTSTRSINAIKRVAPELTKSLDRKGFKFGSPVFIRIFKESNQLELFLKKGSRFELFKTYPICFYSGELGPKTKEGDRQAPEGFYQVTPKSMNPFSSYHLSFNLGYPNAHDRARGWTGSHLMIHGDCVSIGCFAMTDPLIEEIYALVETAFRTGQNSVEVHSFPFRMTEDNLKRKEKHKWHPFWKNLQKGFLLFEESGTLPNIYLKEKEYFFEG